MEIRQEPGSPGFSFCAAPFSRPQLLADALRVTV
jgi:hypothetical protein